jgi:ketosteroid isomerase-like protein
MDTPSSAAEAIEAFFARYTGYLAAGDLDGLAGIYNYPSLAVTAMGCLAITEPQQVRAFFAQNVELYRSRGILGVRVTDIVTDVEVPGVWVGRLVLENLDSDGRPVGRERNAYQVMTAQDGTRRIAVTTPLDAYNPDQQSTA